MPNYVKKMLPSAIILALDIIVLLMIPSQVNELTHDAVTTRFMPTLVCGLIAICAAADLISTFLKERGNTGTDDRYFDRKGFLRVLLAAAAVIVYLLILKTVGFVIASVLITAAAMVLMGNRSVKQIILTSVILSIGVYCIFKLGLNLRLPTGLFFF